MTAAAVAQGQLQTGALPHLHRRFAVAAWRIRLGRRSLWLTTEPRRVGPHNQRKDISMDLTPEYGTAWTNHYWRPRQMTDRPFDDLVDAWYANDPYCSDAASATTNESYADA